MNWIDIINRANRDDYIDKLDEIASILFSYKNNLSEKICLMEGKAGIVIFLIYFAKFKNDKKYHDRAYKLINEIIDAINNSDIYPTFSNGLAGIYWMIEKLLKDGLINQINVKKINHLDEYFYKLMLYDIQNMRYDYLHGAIGYGMYFFNKENDYIIDGYISDLVDKLELISEDESNKAKKWISILSVEKKERIYNLSLSHGIASIISFLSWAYSRNINAIKAKKLLDNAINYLFQNTLDEGSSISIFPSYVSISGEKKQSRLSWCYGDLGIGISLLLTSRRAADKKLENKAIEILKHTTKRKRMKENYVQDAGLCHGTAGIAHIYNRLYNYTAVEQFKEAALYWFKKTLKSACFNDGYAGFKAKRLDLFENEIGLLEGIAGIGLSILAGVSNIEPKWDQCLLLS